MAFNPGMFGQGLGGFLGGMFGDSGRPYDEARDQYEHWMNKGVQAQNPFLQAGYGAIPQFQDWLGGMKDPAGFINKQMGQYQESPWAQYMQQQARQAGINAGSAGGMVGSTPWAQQMQQNAAGISSQDMQNWLGNVLGVNTQYGAGLGGLMQGGQGAADMISRLYGSAAPWMGERKYEQENAKNNDFWNMLGGGIGMAGSFFM